MKKLLPKTSNNSQGFTLVELLVVIAIIAILSVVGITVFGNVQVRGRDARRAADIDSIGKAMEVAKGQTVSYPALAASMFANGAVPTDPTTGQTGARNYCYVVGGTVAGLATPASWATGCPTGWTAITATGGVPAGTSTNPYWRVCASMEGSTAVACTTSQQ